MPNVGDGTRTGMHKLNYLILLRKAKILFILPDILGIFFQTDCLAHGAYYGQYLTHVNFDLRLFLLDAV